MHQNFRWCNYDDIIRSLLSGNHYVTVNKSKYMGNPSRPAPETNYKKYCNFASFTRSQMAKSKERKISSSSDSEHLKTKINLKKKRR